ncbi:MAG: PKD domain-containing protein [Bacteroidota bacterium]
MKHLLFAVLFTGFCLPGGLLAQLCTDCSADFDLTLDVPNLEVTFTNTSSCSGAGSIGSFNWDFGDGNTSTDQNPTHTYLSSTFYRVCLTSLSGSGELLDTHCEIVSFPGISICESSFDVSSNETIGTFSASGAVVESNQSINFLQWQWGDGSPDDFDTDCLTHEFPDAGEYNVCLTVGTDGYCFATQCETVTITKSCDAGFTQDISDLTVAFTDTSTTESLGGIESHFWDFGDGTGSTEENPFHVYLLIGTYDVCLTVTDISGCEDTQCEEITVFETPECTIDFVYFFDGSSEVIFNNTSTSNAQYNLFDWDFGDGTMSMEENPTHTYTTEDNFTVCLFGSTAQGCSDQKCVTVVLINDGTCNAKFDWRNFQNVDDPTTIAFYNQSTSNGNIQSTLWDFGDGEQAPSPNPTHIYSDTGSYQVCLTITDDNGCTSQFCDTVRVNCLAEFGWTPDPMVSTAVNFIDQSLGDNIVEWKWEFTQSLSLQIISNFQNPQFDFFMPGNYLVGLTIRNESPSGEVCVSNTRRGVQTGTASSIEFFEAIPEFLIYPNPANQQFNILMDVQEAGIIHFSLFDLSGKQYTYQKSELGVGQQDVQIPINHLPNGMYFLQIATDKGVYTEKLIKASH